jgi:hypothetical protein
MEDTLAINLNIFHKTMENVLLNSQKYNIRSKDKAQMYLEKIN